MRCYMYGECFCFLAPNLVKLLGSYVKNAIFHSTVHNLNFIRKKRWLTFNKKYRLFRVISLIDNTFSHRRVREIRRNHSIMAELRVIISKQYLCERKHQVNCCHQGGIRIWLKHIEIWIWKIKVQIIMRKSRNRNKKINMMKIKKLQKMNNIQKKITMKAKNRKICKIRTPKMK